MQMQPGSLAQALSKKMHLFATLQCTWKVLILVPGVKRKHECVSIWVFRGKCEICTGKGWLDNWMGGSWKDGRQIIACFDFVGTHTNATACCCSFPTQFSSSHLTERKKNTFLMCTMYNVHVSTAPPSQILQLTKSVGGTNAPRADNFSSATNLSFRWEQSCCTGFVPTAGLDLREGWTDNFVAEKWQICGGAKSALAFFWIDLHRFWQNKNWSLHTAQPKKVCKYLAKIQNEGSRSPWRKIIRSGGIRSPNPLRRVGWGTWLLYHLLLDKWHCPLRHHFALLLHEKGWCHLWLPPGWVPPVSVICSGSSNQSLPKSYG